MCKYPDLDIASVAQKLGFSLVVGRAPEARVELQVPRKEIDKHDSTPKETAVEPKAAEALWMPTYFQAFSVSGGIIDPDPKATIAPTVWRNRPTGKVAHREMMPWPGTRRLLDPVISSKRNSSRPDIDRIIQKFANNQFISRIPLLQRSCFPAQLTLIEDTSVRNIPFREDYRRLIRRIIELAPKDRVVWFKGDAPGRLIGQLSKSKGHRGSSVVEPVPGSAILVLGDFGRLERKSGLASRLASSWKEWCHAMRRQYCELTALVPFSVDYLSPSIRRLVTPLGWVENGVEVVRDPNRREALVRQLFAFAYPATCVEPSLLRDLRLMVRGAADPSLESDFWQHPWLEGRLPSGAKNDQVQIKAELLKDFESLSQDMQERVLRILRNRRGADNAVDLWLSEFLNLTVSMQRLIDENQSDREDAEEMIRELVECFEKQEIDPGVSDLFHWQTWGASDALLTNRTVGPWITKYREKFFPDIPVHHELQSTGQGEYKIVTHVAVRTDGNNVEIQRLTPESNKGGDWGVLRSCDGKLEIQAYLTEEQRFWKLGRKPDWVSDYGRDTNGIWCEFQLPRHDGQGAVTQRMRWIQPGSFMMGSPKNEFGHQNDEYLHRVTLTEGFWLANTTCTQLLWKALHDGENPSHFKRDRNPVETVSWVDVKNWLLKLDKVHPTMGPSLPTESQWEYACRAGSDTMFTFGEEIDELTRYATFNRTSRASSSPVAERQVNEWGLFDIHGNVWEWCEDWYAQYSKDHVTDPIGPPNGSEKVIRGGSWFDIEEYLRSAFRGHDPIDHKAHNVGFRIMCPAMSAEPSFGEQSQNEFKTLSECRLEDFRTIYFSINSINKTDCITLERREVYQLKRFIRPNWCWEFELDDFGYKIQIQVQRSGVTAVQWLRLLNPGFFKMGSSSGEKSSMPDREFLHEVKIDSAFWIFDTPCTQRFWEAVMGSNPSYFKGPNRPVENISWDDAVLFSQRLTTLLGLQTNTNEAFRLPTEEEWEYACRADSTDATYAQDVLIGNRKSPVTLDEIAWYAGNSHIDYDIETGVAISWLTEPKVAGTRNVREKLPNSWGLYDMLGNVWEFCSNWHQGYQQNDLPKKNNESYDTKNRVIRGGSWYDPPNYLRAACRFWQAGDPQKNHGFRLVITDRQQEYRVSNHPQSDFKNSNKIQNRSASSSQFRRFRIKTDQELLHLEKVIRPKWATDFGKDNFGLYSVFQVRGERSAEPVEQRMRWIPSGRFYMGERNAAQEVFITKGFWIFDTPCTQALWSTKSFTNPSQFQDRKRPVENVTVRDICLWIDRLSEKLPIDPNYGFRLPTEAEWEYVCWAGSQFVPSRSISQNEHDRRTELSEIAWFLGNSMEGFELDGFSIGTHRVALKRPNAWGVYDMLGNVWEWCYDTFREDLNYLIKSVNSNPFTVDPFFRINQEYNYSSDRDRVKVIRGGSFATNEKRVTPNSRWKEDYLCFREDLGFRLVFCENTDPRLKRKRGEVV
jgi:formylglycine-generating enzyme required for sulfatase activity